MTFKKLIGKIHLWLGLASGLVVFILGVTGCLFAFQQEITGLVHKDVLYVQPQQKTLPPSLLWENAQKSLGKDMPIKYGTFYKEPGHTAEFLAYDFDPKAITSFGMTRYFNITYVNPYTGQVVGRVDEARDFFNIVKGLHYSLWLNNVIGQPIVGTATLIFVILLISGLILWWPRNKAARKQRFKIKWDASRKRLNYDLHNVLGIYAMGVAAIIALTGLIMAFQWVNKSVHFIATGATEEAAPKPVQSIKPATLVAGPAIDKAMEQAALLSPDAQCISANGFPTDTTGVLELYANERAGTYYYNNVFRFDQYTGALLDKEYFKDKKAGEKLMEMNYDIHVGAIGGLPGKILAFIVSLVAGSLPVTGLYIWLGRKKKAKKDTKKKSSVQKGAYKLPV